MSLDFLEKAKTEAKHAVKTLNATYADSVEATSKIAEAVNPTNLMDLPHRQVVSVVNDFGDLLPIFEQAGLELQKIEVELGISPKLVPVFHIKNLISEDAQKKLLEQLDKKPVIRSLLAAMLKAANLKKHFNIGQLELIGLQAEIAAMPNIRLLFSKPTRQKCSSDYFRPGSRAQKES